MEPKSDMERSLAIAIGRRVERVRELARLNRAQMAAVMMMPAHHVRPIESGERMLRMAEAVALCSMLGTSAGWLLMGIGEMWVDDRWRTSGFDEMDAHALAVLAIGRMRIPE